MSATPADVIEGRARFAVAHGDCRTVMRQMRAGCIRAIVTDVPYGLSEQSEADVRACLAAWLSGVEYLPRVKGGFMGAAWDAWVPGPDVWREALRVLVPGAHVLTFAGTRTQDLVGIALRLAGMEVRDAVAWLQAQGFPKSLDVSKALDAMHGAEREVVGDGPFAARRPRADHTSQGAVLADDAYVRPAGQVITAPATVDARAWAGHGTALKPAHEPVVVARKPLDGTVAANALAHGAGTLNIDACRIGTSKEVPASGPVAANIVFGARPASAAAGDSGGYDPNVGRFPANVAIVHAEGCERIGVRAAPRNVVTIDHGPRPSATAYGDGLSDRSTSTTEEVVDDWRCVDGCPALALDRQAGTRTSGKMRAGTPRANLDSYSGHFSPSHAASADVTGDTGGASRFFFQGKARGAERWVYARCGCLDGPLPAKEAAAAARREGTGDDARLVCVTCGATRTHRGHPTAKPVDLGRWLARLVKPPPHVDAVLLDPFCGSGALAEAALLEGWRVIACDLDPDYVAITRARGERALRGVVGAEETRATAAPARTVARPVQVKTSPAQLGLAFGGIAR